MRLPDQHYLIKLKGIGWNDSRIAARMGITEEEVASAWQSIVANSDAVISNGYIALEEHFRNLANQYQLVGESLKPLGAALASGISIEQLEAEIAKVVTSVEEKQEAIVIKEIAKGLLKKFIILQSFVPPPPQESLESAQQANVNKN